MENRRIEVDLLRHPLLVSLSSIRKEHGLCFLDRAGEVETASHDQRLEIGPRSGSMLVQRQSPSAFAK